MPFRRLPQRPEQLLRFSHCQDTYPLRESSSTDPRFTPHRDHSAPGHAEVLNRGCGSCRNDETGLGASRSRSSCSALLAANEARGVDVTPEEQAAARGWIAAKFEGTVPAGPRGPGLLVLANHDPVLKNTRGEGRPLTIAKTAYDRGLYCHAVSHVVVRLPGPGKTFTAVVGVDSNPQTIGGRGSVVFSVSVGGKPAFRSEVLREGMAGVPVNVELGGATRIRPGSRRCGRRDLLRSGGLGRGPGRPERRHGRPPGRPALHRAGPCRDGRPAVLVCL